MKKQLKAGLIICLVFGILLCALAVWGTVSSDRASELQNSASGDEESKKALAELLGEKYTPSDEEAVVLSWSDNFLISVCGNVRTFAVLGIDLLLIPAIAFGYAILKKKKRAPDLDIKPKSASSGNLTGILMAFIVLCLNLALASSSFFTLDNFLNIMQQISVNFVLAIGMSFALLSGGIDLSVGASVAFTGLFAGIMMKDWGIPVPVAIITCLVIATLTGVLNGWLIAKLSLPPFIATLGTQSILRGADYTITGGSTVSKLPDSFLAISGRIGGVPIIGIIIILVIFFAAWYILKYTSFGRYVYAIGGNEKCAELSGISISKVKIKVYAICGFCSGLAGILLTSRLNSITPTSANGYEMDAITAVILGGTSMSGGSGSIVGTMIGALIIAFISNGLNLLGVGQGPQKMVKGIIIVIAVIIDVMRKKSAKVSA